MIRVRVRLSPAHVPPPPESGRPVRVVTAWRVVEACAAGETASVPVSAAAAIAARRRCLVLIASAFLVAAGKEGVAGRAGGLQAPRPSHRSRGAVSRYRWQPPRKVGSAVPGPQAGSGDGLRPSAASRAEQTDGPGCRLSRSALTGSGYRESSARPRKIRESERLAEVGAPQLVRFDR